MKIISTVQPIDGSPDRYWHGGIEVIDVAEREHLAKALGEIIQAGEHRLHERVARGIGVPTLGTGKASRFRCLHSDKGLFVDLPVEELDPQGRVVLISLGGSLPAVADEWVQEYRRICRLMAWTPVERGLDELREALGRVGRTDPKEVVAAVVGVLLLLAALPVIWRSLVLR